MRIKNKLAAAAVGTGVVLSAVACTPGGGGYYPQSEYCVDNYGHVEPSYYCQPSYPGYGSYFVYMGYVHGHSYGVGSTIPHTYIVKGRDIPANNAAARAKAGIPVSTSFTNGSKAKTSTPAKAQTAPKSPSSSKVSTSTTKSTSTTPKSTTSRTTTSRTTSGFSSSTRSSTSRSTSSFGSSSRSSGGFSSSRSSSSGGRK